MYTCQKNIINKRLLWLIWVIYKLKLEKFKKPILIKNTKNYKKKYQQLKFSLIVLIKLNKLWDKEEKSEIFNKFFNLSGNIKDK